MTVYAVLVGIDEYDRQALRGAVNDIHAVREFMEGLVDKPVVLQLLDSAATRQAVIEGFRDHLGRAGQGDVALFWFAGHGSQQRVPPEFAAIEPSGQLQTLVCVDSRRLRRDGTSVPDLLDKELSLLLTEVAAGGAHVVAVLDCCHAGGATRDLPGARISVRSIDPPEVPVPAGEYLAELGGQLPTQPGEHVLLAACELTQKAVELALDGEDVRGVFSHALLAALQGPESMASYRRLVAQARSAVQVHAQGQTPVVLPAGYGPADRPFLGGEVVRPPAFHLRWTGDGGWEVDAGGCHGLPGPGPDGAATLFVPGDDDQPRLLEVRWVGAVASRVEPVGWTPDKQLVHPVLLATVPVPRCGLVVGGSPDDDAAAAAVVTAAVSRSGPAGGPSPWVRVVQPDDPVLGERLWIGARIVHGRPVLRILRADEDPAAPDVPGFGPDSAAQVVRNAEHIARWDQLRQLRNPLSGLDEAVRIEIFPAGPAETALPPGRPALRPETTGEIRVAYERAGGPPPRVFIRLRNVSDRMLYATLLDLTDQHRSHDALFPCTQIEPGGVGNALSGQPIEVKLPSGRDKPVARDWLKLIVADERFSTLRFQLPALGEPATRGAVGQLQARVLGGVGESGTGGDWGTALLPIVTTVPDESPDGQPRPGAK